MRKTLAAPPHCGALHQGGEFRISPPCIFSIERGQSCAKRLVAPRRSFAGASHVSPWHASEMCRSDAIPLLRGCGGQIRIPPLHGEHFAPFAASMRDVLRTALCGQVPPVFLPSPFHATGAKRKMSLARPFRACRFAPRDFPCPKTRTDTQVVFPLFFLSLSTCCSMLCPIATPRKDERVPEAGCANVLTRYECDGLESWRIERKTGLGKAAIG
jgi:hypothetical protein